ncbi:MAG: hypothetical protein ACJAXA_001496 [Candidatus Aldehydirespiratoraceae bacterium]|jgi:hypothetical protein
MSNSLSDVANHLVSGRRRLIRNCVLIALASGSMVWVNGGSAAAETAGTTTATVTITGGALAITVPTNAGSLGSESNTVGGSTISGQLGQVQVNDARSAGAGAGWVANGISTAFTPPAGATIAASSVSYTAGSITKIGSATYTANDPINLAGISPVVTATGITGDNSATWNPTINVAIPTGTLVGTYSATITHSVT